MNKRGDFELELQRLAMIAPSAIRCLRRVTGKKNLCDIDPLSEKRWSEKCWEHYGILSRMEMMIQTGQHWQEVEAGLVKSFKPSEWVGKVKVSKFRLPKRFEKAFPDLKERWKSA